MPHSIKTIKNRSTFLKVKNQGKFFYGKSFNLQLLEDYSLNNMIFVGYIATKRLGNAVKRNKAKRLMRELSRKVFSKYGKTNSYYVLIAKKSIFSTSFEMQKNELKDLIL